MTDLWVLLLIPALCAPAAAVLPGPRSVLALCAAGSLATLVAASSVAGAALRGRAFAGAGQLFADPLSVLHVLIVTGVFFLSSLYAWRYFAPGIRRRTFGRRAARRFGAFWFAFLATMLLVLTANNVGLMWIGMEATTVFSALLVCLELEAASIRAAWTYVMMCSVGIALALLGVFLVCGEAHVASGAGESVFLWTDLVALAPRMRPGPLELAFIFILVGYGTKAGLAPLHAWLPDAHSQAPTPVSAVLSGVLLNCALYCVCRFLPIVDAAGGHPGWALRLLVVFGMVSIGVAAAFIVHETDIKRLLAFHSVEHMGIITLGLGLGAVPAALYHTLNHSVCKMLTFFCAGALVQRHGSRDMRRMGRILSLAPAAGAGIVLGILALVGCPPFSIFMSELWIVRDGVTAGHPWAVAAFLAGAAVVFVAALSHAMEMVWRAPDRDAASSPARSALGWPLVALPLALLVVLGVWIPNPLMALFHEASAVIRGVPW